ncbi:MAG: hypothetical protein ACOH2M_27745 [Cypionkella sp.]
MRALLAAMLVTLCAAPAPALADGPLTADALRAMIADRGATTVVQSLDNGDDENNPWFGVLDHIEAGEPDWIELVPLLAPGTDAGTAESLVITLSRGLKTNPAAILRIVVDEDLHNIADLCQDNDIEVSDAEVAAFTDNAIAAVTAITDPALAEARSACLAQLSATRPAS